MNAVALFTYLYNISKKMLFVIFTIFDFWNLNAEGLKWMKIFLLVVNLLPVTFYPCIRGKVEVDYHGCSQLTLDRSVKWFLGLNVQILSELLTVVNYPKVQVVNLLFLPFNYKWNCKATLGSIILSSKIVMTPFFDWVTWK